MSDWIDRLSNEDDENAARKERVAAASHRIFDSLLVELNERISKYNERHPPQDPFSPNAVWIKQGPFESTAISCVVQKNTEPQRSVTLRFLINSGAMSFRWQSKTANYGGTLELDISNDAPSFDLGGTNYSSESLADFLLRLLLDPYVVLRKNAVDRLGQAERAHVALQRAGKHTAASELREASADLSKDPPDLTGAVQHSLAALECVAREHCGDHATFGKLLQQYPDLFPKPLDKGIEKVWGFASEMGRHLQEGRMPKEEEAELLVGLATACSTYPVRKIEGQR